MSYTINEDVTVWAVCHGPNALHFTRVEPEQVLETGQPNCEHFYTEQEAIDRCLELNPDWTHPNESG